MLSVIHDDPVPRNRRRRLAQIGQRIAHQRWQQQQRNPLVFRRKHNELHGDNPSYSNCIFLNEHDIVLAYSTASNMDVLQLPTLTKGHQEVKQLAGRLGLQQQQPQRSLAPHNKVRLHSIESGKSFAVGRSCGKFDVFATEHVSSWQQQYASNRVTICQESLSSTIIQRGYRFDSLLREPPSAHHPSYQHLLMSPLSTYQEMLKTPTRALVQQQDPACLEFHQQSLQLQRDMCPPAPDALWDFQDRPSYLLALHVLTAGSDCTLRVMDTRLPESSSVVSIDLHSNVVETVTATCFASPNTIVTSHNQGLNQPETFIKTWDIRQQAAPLTEDLLSVPQGSFIQHLSFSKQKATVMLSLANCQNHNGNNHIIWDLGLRSMVARYSLPPSSAFAVTPNHDIMVCSQESQKPDLASASNLFLFDLSTSQRRHSASSAASKISSRKRTRGQDEAANILTPVTTMQPVLEDRYGLCTDLTCLAINATGTSLIGGSADGDIFAWRGSDTSTS